MVTIKLTAKDINEMVTRTVRSILSESVREAMGSAMSNKEGVVKELVDYIEKEWERIKTSGEPPKTEGTFGSSIVPSAKGTVKSWVILPPDDIAKKFDIADKLDINIGISNYELDPKLVDKVFGYPERGTEATTYHANDDTGTFRGEFSKTTLKIKNGRIDLFVPAINGDLQTQGLYTTLYHELNHAFTGLKIKQGKYGKIDRNGWKVNVDRLNPVTTRKSDDPHKNPHFIVQYEMHPDAFAEFVQKYTYGPDLEEFKKINYLFYALWEITEMNARAEEMYGDLQYLNATRANFKALYPQTNLYHNLEGYKEKIKDIKKLPSTSKVWDYVAKVMGMVNNAARKGYKPEKTFGDYVKRRFINHSEELLEKLYRKGMKVAELYFQEHEPKPKPSRLQQYKDARRSIEAMNQR